MNLLQDTIISVVPARHTTAPYEGATRISFNCPLCHTKGHSRDTKKRGAFFLGLDGSAGYDCFQCQTRTRQSPHLPLTNAMREVLSALGIQDSELAKLSFDLAAAKYASQNAPRVILPNGLRSIVEWLEQGCSDPRLLEIAAMLEGITPPLDLHRWYWTDDDNGQDLSHYYIGLIGDLSWPTGWIGTPYPDIDRPTLTHRGIWEEPDDEIPQAVLDEGREAVFADDEDEESK